MADSLQPGKSTEHMYHATAIHRSSDLLDRLRKMGLTGRLFGFTLTTNIDANALLLFSF